MKISKIVSYMLVAGLIVGSVQETQAMDSTWKKVALVGVVSSGVLASTAGLRVLYNRRVDAYNLRMLQEAVMRENQDAALAAIDRLVQGRDPEVVRFACVIAGIVGGWMLGRHNVGNMRDAAAFVNQTNNRIARLIDSPPASPLTTQEGCRILAIAAKKGLTPVVSRLIQEGVSQNAVVDHWTPLEWALRFGHLEAGEALVNSGAECRDGQTLSCAIRGIQVRSVVRRMLGYNDLTPERDWKAVDMILNAEHKQGLHKQEEYLNLPGVKALLPGIMDQHGCNVKKVSAREKLRLWDSYAHSKVFAPDNQSALPQAPLYQSMQKKLGDKYPEFRSWKRQQPGSERFDGCYNAC